MSEAVEKKQEVREYILPRIPKIERKILVTASSDIKRHLMAFFKENAIGLPALFMPLEEEPNVFRLLRTRQQARARSLIPYVTDENAPLEFKEFTGVETLQPHPTLGFKQPPESLPSEIPDFLGVPLVAFDMKGNRLGRGRGFYDRTIAHFRQHHPNVPIFGIAYGCCNIENIPHIENLPTEPHDQKLDGVFKESGLITF